MISLSQVCFAYADERAECLSDINLSVRKGEFVLLCGKSGCGKTSLTRLVNGLIPHFYEGTLSGTVLIDGLAPSTLPLQETARRVGSVFQDPRSQFFTTDITSEIAFACENRQMDRTEMVGRIAATVEEMRIENLLDRNIFQLSSGEKQKVAIASSAAPSPGILVLDEPSANLDSRSVKDLRAILGALKDRGATILIAEHRLQYLEGLVDRAIYMADGKIEGVFSGDAFFHLPDEKLRQLGLRRTGSTGPAVPCKRDSIPAGPPLLQSDSLCYSHTSKAANTLDHLKLNVHSGEVVAITGYNGEGKSTFARVLCGLLKEKSGKICVGGVPLKMKKRRSLFYYVMQDADYQLFSDSVLAELQLGLPATPQIEQRAHHMMEQYGLLPYADTHPAALSGGQKQRVTIAAAGMREDARVLIFDEPTSGLDAENMARVADMLVVLAREGRAVLVITHDEELVQKCCNRTLELRNGKLVEQTP